MEDLRDYINKLSWLLSISSLVLLSCAICYGKSCEPNQSLKEATAYSKNIKLLNKLNIKIKFDYNPCKTEKLSSLSISNLIEITQEILDYIDTNNFISPLDEPFNVYFHDNINTEDKKINSRDLGLSGYYSVRSTDRNQIVRLKETLKLEFLNPGLYKNKTLLISAIFKHLAEVKNYRIIGFDSFTCAFENKDLPLYYTYCSHKTDSLLGTLAHLIFDTNQGLETKDENIFSAEYTLGEHYRSFRDEGLPRMIPFIEQGEDCTKLMGLYLQKPEKVTATAFAQFFKNDIQSLTLEKCENEKLNPSFFNPAELKKISGLFGLK